MALQFYLQQSYNYLYAAYQPIVFRVFMDYPVGAPQPALPPVVYLDIYLNGTYYRTLSKSVYEVQPWLWQLNFPFLPLFKDRPFWNFDVSDAVQEYLRSLPPSITNPRSQQGNSAICTLQVAVRGSNYDTSGFLAPEGPKPVQGDFYNPPQPGGGTFSGNTRVLNATLRPEDNPDLYTHLKAYQSPGTVAGYDILTLSHRVSEAYNVGAQQQDFISLYIPSNGLSGNLIQDALLRIQGWTRAGVYFVDFAAGSPLALTAGTVQHLPSGPQQLSIYNWSALPPWGEIDRYSIAFSDPALPLRSFWASPVMKVTRADTKRLIFLNAVGGWDGISFCERTEVQDTKSATWQKSRPLVGGTRRDGGGRRFNVRSTRTLTLRTNAFPEKAQSWLAELLRSPQVYLIQPGADGQAADYLPVRVLDGRIVTRKETERYTYEAELAVQYADDLLSQRN